MTTTPLVFIFWLAAAGLVVEAHRHVDPRSILTGFAVKTAIIVAVAGVYMKTFGHATIEHALGVGATWLALSILVEITVSLHAGRGWFELLGSPASGLRNVVMFAWVAAPVLFARERTEQQP